MTGRGCHVVDAMLFACPPEDALRGVAVLEAVVASARSGRRETID
jgi:hypothetical protein